jgi:TadE-like protein
MTERLRDEAGMTSTELAVLMPVLILLVLLPFQVALWWHAKQAADVAAEECVESAQVPDADVAAAGASGARAILGQAGNLRDVSVRAVSTGTSVVCDVAGTLNYSVIGHYGVSARAEGPLERFVAEDDR